MDLEMVAPETRYLRGIRAASVSQKPNNSRKCTLKAKPGSIPEAVASRPGSSVEYVHVPLSQS